MKLSDVKTDADFEQYEAGKIAQTWETLQAGMGIGPRAFSLPDPSRSEMSEDGFYAYNKRVSDREF